MSKKEKKINHLTPEDEIILDIPEDEIYTYKIEGLAAPHINKPYKHYTLKKIIFIAVIVVAVSLSIFFSLMVLRNDTFSFEENENGVTFTKFSNPGYIEELTINWELDIVYPENKEAHLKDFVTVTDAPDNAPQLPLKSKEELLAYQKYHLKQAQERDKERAERNNSLIPYFEITENKAKPVTKINPYTINGDGNIKTIYIGENVLDIDGKAFYSCWALQRIIVDENNPNYCDIDGVLYTKDKKTVICYPCDRDQYLREKHGYVNELWKDAPKENNKAIMSEELYKEIYEEYTTLIMTYAIPSEVTHVGELCFNYSNLRTVYLPESLKEIGNLGFFEMPNLKYLYTYVTEAGVTETDYEAVKELECYLSLPDGLERIGTDAFSFNKEMEYIFIPASVTEIGHHAFWDTVYSAEVENEEGKKVKQLCGISTIYIERTKEEFRYKKTGQKDAVTGEDIYNGVLTGDEWIPVANSNLLTRIPVEYGAERRPIE